MRISHNLVALNAQNNMNLITGKRVKSMEKLSSGYKINRAADDAAGLAISEKMRRLIRGLDQGTENAVDGVSWVQIGDGALNEAHDILHRMTELTVKALNETNTDSDKMAMELEFEELQSELDRISTTTRFNEIPIFDQHEQPYYQCEGGVKWDPQQMHVVTAGKNDLTFRYRESENTPPVEMEITIPAGEYTTQELVDEIDTVLSQKNLTSPQIQFEFTEQGICNANLEGGERMDAVSGSLSYLMYQMYKGGGYGALIGTTSFPTEYSRLKVVNGQNNTLNFSIEDFAGNSQQKNIVIPEGSYTRSELIDYLNNQLSDTTVKATAYGSGIKLSSDDAIVTGFKGNMFKIDGSGTVYNSVFYDNVKYGSATQKPASFTGGYVLPTDSRDEEHKYYEIDSSNNTLTLTPNKAGNAVNLVIPDGKYTADQMKDKLNELFTTNALALAASKIELNGYEGIKITSTIDGLSSEIGMDTSSSAYNTLFITRKYNSYGAKVQPVNENRADSEGKFSGSKDLSTLSTTPLTVTAGVNDSFKLAINGAEYTISLMAGTYNSAQALETELNNQLNGANALAGYKGKISASVVSGKMILTGNAGQGVNTIRVTANGTNTGIDSVFQGYSNKTTFQEAKGTGTVTLNTPFDGTIDASEKDMDITVDGIKYDVTLPTGTVTQDDIKNAIETVIKDKTVPVNNTFVTVSNSGSDGDRKFSKTANGTTNITSWSKSVIGSSEEKEGVVGFIKSEPAVLEIGVPLKSSMSVGTGNNTIALTLNGQSKTLTLDNGTYSPATLQSQLQKKIDAAFGTGMGGATVSISNGKLVLTSRLPQGEDGSLTSISCSTSNSSFLKELNTTRNPAEWTSNLLLASSITIDNSSQSMVFNYTENGTTKQINLTLNQGTYTPSSMVTEINNQLAKTGTGITASLSSGKLALKSSAVGSGVSISYSTDTGGGSANVLYGPLKNPSEASVVVNRNTESTIKIEAGVSDEFSITVNGAKQTVTLDAGDYDINSFVAMLNTKFAGAGIQAEAFASGNKLGYRTTNKGNAAYISMSYGDGGSSMKAIYGVTQNHYSGVTVSFAADGKMTLSTTNPASSISVGSSTGGAFQKPQISSTPISMSYTDGYHSNTKAYIDGENLGTSITIDEWNNTLNFTFKDAGTDKAISVEVPDGTYGYADLQTKLQDLLDAQAGSNKITVSVTSSGVRLESVNAGSTYKLSGFSGDFYDKVICSCTERTSTMSATEKAGTQTVDSAYTIGRKDVRNNKTIIRRGVSDEMSLDLTYGGSVHTIRFTLDAGEYTADKLKKHIQDKINEQLTGMGLAENLIEVGIGGINTGVYGSNDQNALNFSLSKTVNVPGGGQFIIDGVKGSAAFEVFYQTDGKMEPAYIRGTKDISSGVTIPADKTELSFVVDGVRFDISIPPKEYSPEELLRTINDGLDAAGAPIIAEDDSGIMRISHRKMGEHDIQEVSGSAKNIVFFNENGEEDAKSVRYVKLSSEDGDYIDLKRHIFNTPYLKVNSLCISKIKNAEKALERLKQAVIFVSNIRSDFGSTQNRLEHAIANNENKEENLQSAESLIRDTDMAKEMMAFSNHNIILQAGQAMLAQANQIPQGVLQLLQ